MRFRIIEAQLNEKLSLDLARRITRDYGWDRNLYDDMFGKGIWRVNIPLGEVNPWNDIEDALERGGYSVKDGKAIKGEQETKIGKALGKLKIDKGTISTLQKKYATLSDESSKSGKEQSEYNVIISRHPYDIIGMSADRSWTSDSCMRVDGKTGECLTNQAQSAYKHVKINSLIAYVVKSTDTNINNPIGRYLITPYENNDGVYLKRNSSVYGKTVEGFEDAIDDWLNENQKELSGIFNFPDVYNDGDAESISRVGEEYRLKTINELKEYGVIKCDIKDEGYGNWFIEDLLNGYIKVTDAIIDITTEYSIIFKSGTWEKGIWEYGEWIDGTWKDGTWVDGTWKGGTWIDGVWEDGIWRGGVWKGGTWEDGVWKGGTWKDGTWKDGVWEDGVWEGGIWRGGIWEGGVWEKGEIEYARDYSNMEGKTATSYEDPNTFKLKIEQKIV